MRIVHGGRTIADSVQALRLIETSHPPSYYIPPGDIDFRLLRAGQGRSFCGWKGHVGYWDVLAGAAPLLAVGWSYPGPASAYAPPKDHVAFYAAPFDACCLGDKQVRPQPGGFYNGWITSDLAGPFIGVEGSRF